MRVYIECVTIWRSCLVVLCLMPAACGGEVASGGARPLELPRDSKPAPYRVQVGDELSIRLFYTPELNEDVTVRPDGRITTTLAQSVTAAGRTPDDVAGALRALYNTELRDPVLTVGVKSYAPMRIYVGGGAHYQRAAVELVAGGGARRRAAPDGRRR